MSYDFNLAIIGCGNIGAAIARGLVESKIFRPNQIYLSRRKIELLEGMKSSGFMVSNDKCEAVKIARIVILAVEPQQLSGVLNEIAGDLQVGKHLLISIVSGASISEIKKILGKNLPVVRAMPNIAIAISESMTCLSADPDDVDALRLTKEIFDQTGKAVTIDEELMVPATALCACGIAFFFRAIRAASQGGIEIGFHSEEALAMAAQTAKGAAGLLNHYKNHPETEIDRVTTPRGCTIAGLNNMEHQGFSSAMIKGIVSSAEKAEMLFRANGRTPNGN